MNTLKIRLLMSLVTQTMVAILILIMKFYEECKFYSLSCADRSMQVKEMVECTRKAWNLVKGRLYIHGKLIKLILRITWFYCAVYVPVC